MSKLVRVDEDCEVILRKYSDGSINDCIRAMEAAITAHEKEFTKDSDAIIAAIDKRISAMMSKYELGQQNVNKEILSRLPKIGSAFSPASTLKNRDTNSTVPPSQ